MGTDTTINVLALETAAVPCTVCTILIGPGYHESRVHRDASTGWRVCGACLAYLRRQQERERLQGAAG